MQGTMASALTEPVQSSTILVIEDEEALRFTLRHNLEREGYRVLAAGRGDDGLRLARQEQPQLIILDLMLPGIDGIQVCRLLRRDLKVPIIMLTALAGEADRVVGLDAGADDYIAKPFGMRELLARVRAQLRRAEAPAAAATPDRLVAGTVEIDTARREARRGDEVLHFKPRELDLLVFLARNAGRVYSREQILEEVWGTDFAGSARTVDVHVRWIRQKIEPNPADPVHLITVRGSGYRFER